MKLIFIMRKNDSIVVQLLFLCHYFLLLQLLWLFLPLSVCSSSLRACFVRAVTIDWFAMLCHGQTDTAAAPAQTVALQSLLSNRLQRPPRSNNSCWYSDHIVITMITSFTAAMAVATGSLTPDDWERVGQPTAAGSPACRRPSARVEAALPSDAVGARRVHEPVQPWTVPRCWPTLPYRTWDQPLAIRFGRFSCTGRCQCLSTTSSAPVPYYTYRSTTSCPAAADHGPDSRRTLCPAVRPMTLYYATLLI